MAPKFPDLSKVPQYQPTLMLSDPGIQKDGTRLACSQYLDGQWTRFYQSRPRKMLGYREQLRDLDGIARALDVQSYDGFSYVHAGQQDVLQRYTINISSGLTSGLIDRTPIGFAGDPDNNWQFSIMYDTANDANLLFAHAAPNILDISSTTNRPIYYGEVRDTAALIELTPTDPMDIAEVSGGVVAIWPYLVRFGNDGFVGWSMPGQPLTTSGTGSGTARPCGTKIVRALPLRGTSGPACLLWSLDSLVRMQFVGGTEIFSFDTITTSSSILSSNSVIEHEGIYYWPTTSGFVMFNGVMRNVKNDDNVQFFLDTVNYENRQKIFSFKVPRWGEIWWCFPHQHRDDTAADESNHALIYNYKEGFWYDTHFPSPMKRSAGFYEQIYRYPIMASGEMNDTGGYSMWQHEYGLNQISGAVPVASAIQSFIETHEMNLIVPAQPGGLGLDRNQSFSLLEPDFDQSGDLTLIVNSRQNARAAPKSTVEKIIPADPSANEELVKIKHTGRLNSFRIESNTLDGNFVFGSPLIHSVPGDGRRED